MVIVGLGLIGFLHPAFALQYERPDGVASGDWASGSYTEIDESVRNDADYTKSSRLAKSQTDVVTFTISDVTDPNVSTGHIIRYTYKEDALGSNSPSLIIRLLQGTTQITSWTQSSPLPSSFTLSTRTLTTAQANAITNYTNLRLEFTASCSASCSNTVANTDSVSVSWAEFEVPNAIPSGVTELTATAVSTSQINLSWTAPSDGGSPITGYKIDRESPVGGGWSTIVANSGSTSTTYSNTGLTDNTQYNYRVSAINSIGTGSASAPANATTPVLQTIPLQVTGLTATAVSTSQINLSWTAPSDGGSPITGYKIDRESPVGGGWSTIVANSGSTSTTYSNTGLTDNTQYNYRVSAINNSGESLASDTTSAYTLVALGAPSQPLNLSGTLDGTSYTLSWNTPSDDGGSPITDYLIEYSQDGLRWSTYDDGVGTTTSVALTGLSVESYYFRVFAVNATGTSLPSNQIHLTGLGLVPDTPTESDSITDSNKRNPPKILGLGVYKITVLPEITKNDGTKKETNRFENYFPYSINSYVTDQEMYGTHEKTGRFFKIDDLNLPTSLEISPNDLIQLQVQLLDEYHSSQIEHVALYFQDPGTVKKDTFIAFDKSESLQISDPNNIFDDVHVSTSLEEGYLWANFDIKFAKPTDLDVLIESWHESRRPVYEQIRNVLAESNPQEIIQRQTQIGFVSKVIVPDRIASSPNCKDDNACFDPYITNVLKEGIVIWENKDAAFTHTITSGSPDSGPNNRFNGLVQPGESFYNVFAVSGQYQYYCVIHPWAQGIINVVDEKVSAPIETLHVSGTNVAGEVRLPNKEQFPILVKSIISGKAEVINPNQNVISETKSLNVEISGFVGTENPTDNVELFIVRPNGVMVSYKVPVTEKGHYFFPTSLSDKWLDGKYQITIKYGGKQIGSLSFLVSDKKSGKGFGGVLSTSQQLVIGELVDNMIYKGMHDQFLESGWAQITFDDPQHTDLFMPNEEALLQESKLEPKISQTLNIKFEYYYLFGITPVIVWVLLFKRKIAKT